MTWLGIQGFCVLLVTGTPLVVVWVIAGVAEREYGARFDRARSGLTAATVVAWLAFAAWFAAEHAAIASRQRDLALAAAELACFVALGGLGMVRLHRISEACQQAARKAAQSAEAVVRRASLRPRSVTGIIAKPLLALPYLFVLLGLPLLILRLPAFHIWARGVIPAVGSAIAALAFLFLYGVWMKEEAAAARPLDSEGSEVQAAQDCRSRVWRVYSLQLTLVAVFTGSALILAGLDWSKATGQVTGAVTSLAGGVIGVVGCALAISSGLSRPVLQQRQRGPAVS
jgi:hypothetical protein